MSTGVRLFTRIALFSALVYVFSWATSYLPNVSFAFFIVFTTGFLWGKLPGMLVGIIGMGLTTVFNPFGPAHPYMMIAQVLGMTVSGIAGDDSVGRYVFGYNAAGTNDCIFSYSDSRQQCCAGANRSVFFN